MSYCRWSSDNFDCDLYCFESDRGFETNVATHRHRAWLRFIHWLTDQRVKIDEGLTVRFSRFHFTHWPHRLTHKRIGLPYDGKSYTDKTEAEMFALIRGLAACGYHIPDSLKRPIQSCPK